MTSAPLQPFRIVALAVLTSVWLTGCGGGSGGGSSAAENSITSGSVILKPPMLSFTDTGVSVSDGVTRKGLWSVDSTDSIGWEFSLDLGKTWIRGDGNSFEVMGDGKKTIWVRARDDFGNTSEIVVANCTLDTMSPTSLAAVSAPRQSASQLSLQGLEQGALWELSLDAGKTWFRGAGDALSVTGNDTAAVQIRQVDVAGNPSAPIGIDVRSQTAGWVELSTDAMQPNEVGRLNHALLIHGEVVAGDADYLTFEVPAGFRLGSAAFISYESTDRIAFYALQRKAVFDAGFDTTRMLAFGHFGPDDLSRNLLATLPAAQLGAGPLTVWVQQTGSAKTRYALLITIERAM